MQERYCALLYDIDYDIDAANSRANVSAKLGNIQNHRNNACT